MIICTMLTAQVEIWKILYQMEALELKDWGLEVSLDQDLTQPLSTNQIKRESKKLEKKLKFHCNKVHNNLNLRIFLTAVNNKRKRLKLLKPLILKTI